MKEKLKNIVPYIVILVISIMYLLACTLATPMFEWRQSIDSSVFITSAKEILDGKIMYRDIFDHKGPILFIINIVGIIISNGEEFGIWIMEVISLFISASFLYKTAKLFFSKNKLLSLMISVLFVFIMKSTRFLSGGNLTEEYSLPFIFASLYFFIKYLKSGDIVHNPKYMYIHGIMFSCAIMLKASTVAIWVAIGIQLFVILIKHKEYKNIGKNIMYGALGMLTIIGPIVIYFALNNALYDFIYTTLTFNFKYSSSPWDTKIKTVFSWLALLRFYKFAFLGGIISLFFKDRVNRKISIFLIIFTLITFGFISVTGGLFPHYGMVLYPALMLAILLFMNFIIEKIRSVKVLNALEIISIWVVSCIIAYMGVVTYAQFESTKGNRIIEKTRVFRENIDSIENGELYVLGNGCAYYNELNVLPDFKYIYIYPIASVDENIFEETKQYIEQEKPKFIIIQYHLFRKNEEYMDICNFVKERYEFVCEENGDSLYKIKINNG